MAKKVTPELIQRMQDLYEILKTYSAGAKEVGVSASTVSKYLKQANTTKNFSTYNGPEPSYPTKEQFFSFSSLTEAEKTSLISWIGEF